MSDELYSSHPAMFKNSPGWFVICLILCPIGIGLVAFLIWWLQVKATLLTVDDEKTVLRRGLLSKHTNEVRHRDVRNIKVAQSFFQRVFGVGAIEVSSAGQADEEITVSGIPDPEKVKEIINAHRNLAPSNGNASVADQLEKLALLKERGILTDDEFQEQKERLLA